MNRLDIMSRDRFIDIGNVNYRYVPAHLGGNSGRAPPLPIPNREVKPARADGTARSCGRVGRRLLQASGYRKITRGFFYSRTVHPSTHERSGFGFY